MLKAFLFLSFITLGTYAHAEEQRVFKKIDANNATVVITPEGGKEAGVQAASYVDARENKKFLETLLADPASELSKIKSLVEMENCDENSKPGTDWIDGCGEVELSEAVLTGFGRGGWAGAGAAYTLFLGFRSQGSGHFLESLYMVVLNEDVSADVDSDGDYQGTVTKTLSLAKITKLPIDPAR